MMGALADAALAQGAEVIGVIPRQGLINIRRRSVGNETRLTRPVATLRPNSTSTVARNLVEKEVAHTGCTSLRVVESMHHRRNPSAGDLLLLKESMDTSFEADIQSGKP